jgi:putative acetyltransferase
MIRIESDLDGMAIRRVHELAFGGCEEADLVDRLRAAGLVLASLVAEEGDGIVGHILCSALDAPLPTAALAPLAVIPAWQRRGLGGSLVVAGLELCRERGVQLVTVVGEPQYYSRFGFSSELGTRISSPFSLLGKVWMGMELLPGALGDGSVRVDYPSAWGPLL